MSSEIDRYLNLLALDAEQVERAKAAWTIIDPHMPDLIEQFYEHLLETSSKRLFESKDLSAIKSAQLIYWRALFAGKFEPAYQTHVNLIWERHRAAGVQMTDYIAAYAWFSERFFQLIDQANPAEPDKRRSLLTAVNKVIYLDMIIATSASNAFWIDV